MSKVRVDAALEFAVAGDAESVRIELEEVSNQFLDKRLSHLASMAVTRPAVLALREILNAQYRFLPGLNRALMEPPRTPIPPHRALVPQALTLDQAGHALRFLSTPAPCDFQFDEARLAQMWALVGIAARARNNENAEVSALDRSTAGRFAYAVGMTDVIVGIPHAEQGERGRTHKLTRVTDPAGVEDQARAIAHLMLPDDANEEVRKTIQYVLIELFRNVLQHSADPLGGVVGAQLMTTTDSGYAESVVQVAVADCGVGIPAALAQLHPGLDGPRAALAKALEPHISGTFVEGRTGSRYNAGMGLFFISEMAKLTAGRLVIATREAALYLEGDPEFIRQEHAIRFIQPEGTGFPGTLVAFELPLNNVEEHDALIQTIRAKAEERIPPRDVLRVLLYETPPTGINPVLVRFIAEDAVAAEKLSRERFVPAIFGGKPIALDFRGMDICTQSFLHALLYRPIRHSWADRVPIYVLNAAPAVLAGLQLVESYALSG